MPPLFYFVMTKEYYVNNRFNILITKDNDGEITHYFISDKLHKNIMHVTGLFHSLDALMKKHRVQRLETLMKKIDENGE